MSMHATDWHIWENSPHFSPAAFVETLDGGQAFRWNRIGADYQGIWGANTVRLRLINGTIEYAATDGIARQTIEAALAKYFATDTDFAALTDALPWRSDPVLKQAIDAFPGLRLLRQPLGETLLCFLCSPTKRIPQIKATLENLARQFGQPLPLGGWQLPDWPKLAQLSEDDLRTTGLGYRARSIHRTAQRLAEEPGWLAQLADCPPAEARERLCQLPGVGRKIADCVLLFSGLDPSAFPIDTWIARVLSERYGLENWSQAQLLRFAEVHFGPQAGLAQQYLFAAYRK